MTAVYLDKGSLRQYKIQGCDHISEPGGLLFHPVLLWFVQLQSQMIRLPPSRVLLPPPVWVTWSMITRILLRPWSRNYKICLLCCTSVQINVFLDSNAATWRCWCCSTRFLPVCFFHLFKENTIVQESLVERKELIRWWFLQWRFKSNLTQGNNGGVGLRWRRRGENRKKVCAQQSENGGYLLKRVSVTAHARSQCLPCCCQLLASLILLLATVALAWNQMGISALVAFPLYRTVCVLSLYLQRRHNCIDL